MWNVITASLSQDSIVMIALQMLPSPPVLPKANNRHFSVPATSFCLALFSQSLFNFAPHHCTFKVTAVSLIRFIGSTWRPLRWWIAWLMKLGRLWGNWRHACWSEARHWCLMDDGRSLWPTNTADLISGSHQHYKHAPHYIRTQYEINFISISTEDHFISSFSKYYKKKSSLLHFCSRTPVFLFSGLKKEWRN